MMSGNVIRGLEWFAFAISGVCVILCAVAAIYVFPRASQRQFNEIWKTRLLLQLAALSLAFAQVLPLQLWDSRGSAAILPKSFEREGLCKAYTVASHGVLQPFLLFLSSFLCSHALRDPFGKAYSWYRPGLFAAACMLPFSAAQVLCGWWSTWLEKTVDEDDEIGALPFSSYSHIPCPGSSPVLTRQEIRESDCIACKCSFCSLVVHLILAITYLVLILVYSRALINLCHNTAMRHRIRFLCALLPTLQLIQCVAMAVTVVKRRPHRWAHEVADLVALAAVITLITAVVILLVIVPLRSASRALNSVKLLGALSRVSSMSSTALSVRHEASEAAHLHLLPGPLNKASDHAHEEQLAAAMAVEPQPLFASSEPQAAPLRGGRVVKGSIPDAAPR